ncbi:hypothetical protein ACCD08_06090 [Telluria sp. Tellsp104]
MRNDIIQRVLSVIRSETSERRRLKELEEETGIPDRNWKQVWSGKQRPTAHMMEALCRRWPEYAFWVATGITDERNGHTAPKGAWTCSQAVSTPEAKEAARKYFGIKIYYQDLTYGPSGATSSNYVLKKHPTDDEIEAAKAAMKPEQANMQGVLDTFFGKEVQVWKQKYADLDDAIAQLAFERRLGSFAAEYPDVHESNSPKAISSQLAKAQFERLAVREKEVNLDVP